MEITLHIAYQFHWWHIPVLLLVIFLATYVKTATKLIATNDFKKGKK